MRNFPHLIALKCGVRVTKKNRFCRRLSSGRHAVESQSKVKVELRSNRSCNHRFRNEDLRNKTSYVDPCGHCPVLPQTFNTWWHCYHSSGKEFRGL